MCDAGHNVGIPFSKACCITEQHTGKLWPFGGVFLVGYTILRDFLKNRELPKQSVERSVLASLLNFLCDEGSKVVFDKVSEFPTETELTEFFACHLFSKLNYSENYTLDKYMQYKDKTCPCGCESYISEHFGNTSLGHPSTWHGNLDIHLGSVSAAVQIPVVSEHSRGGQSSIGVKKHYGLMEKIPVMSQIIAQTIVFSFYQKARHKEYNHFLIPCIGASGKEVIFFFYDSKHDVLLQSKAIQFRSGSYIAVIAIWLVVNYKYLCTGLSEDMVKGGKAGFFTHVKDSLRFFENELKFGKVIECNERLPYDPYLTRGIFEWPESFPANDL